MISIGASTKAKKCQLNSETRSTSVVISVMICALLLKSFSASSFFSASAGFTAPSTVEEVAAETSAVMGASPIFFSVDEDEEATSFRRSVLAKRIVLSWTFRLTCRVVVERDQS